MKKMLVLVSNDDNLFMDIELRCLQSDRINKSKTRQIGIQENINIHHMSWCISNLWIKSHFWISLWVFLWWSTLDMFASWHSITNMRFLLSMPRNHPVKGYGLWKAFKTGCFFLFHSNLRLPSTCLVWWWFRMAASQSYHTLLVFIGICFVLIFLITFPHGGKNLVFFLYWKTMKL